MSRGIARNPKNNIPYGVELVEVLPVCASYVGEMVFNDFMIVEVWKGTDNRHYAVAIDW